MVDIKPEPRIDEARQLLVLLDQTGLRPEAFMWLYLPNINSWRLIIGSSSFNNSPSQTNYAGFLNSYRSAQQVQYVGWENITLLPTTDPLLILMRSAIRTGRNDNSNLRFSSTVINGVLIDDAFIYRLF